jgi:RNA recognition motif-containing protein
MTNIYVGNLSYTATDDDVREAFEQYGAVDKVSVVKDRETGRSRGFAFVEMPDGNEAKEAIEKVNLAEIAGRKVTVNEAKPREDRGGGGGGGRRRY